VIDLDYPIEAHTFREFTKLPDVQEEFKQLPNIKAQKPKGKCKLIRFLGTDIFRWFIYKDNDTLSYGIGDYFVVMNKAILGVTSKG
jgi:hypothetical protein